MFGSRLFWVIVLALAAAYYFGPHPFKGSVDPSAIFSAKNFRVMNDGGFTSAKPSAPAGSQAPSSVPNYGRLGDGDPNPAPCSSPSPSIGRG